MNERIRELAKQAGLYEKSTTIKIPGTHSPEMYPRFLSAMESHAAYERFAKLIVAECVQTLVDNTPEYYTNEVAEEDWDKGYDRAMRDCVHHIQEYFGADE